MEKINVNPIRMIKILLSIFKKEDINKENIDVMKKSKNDPINNLRLNQLIIPLISSEVLEEETNLMITNPKEDGIIPIRPLSDKSEANSP